MSSHNITIIWCILLLLPGFRAFSQGDSAAVSTWQTGWRLDGGGGVQALFSSDVTSLSFAQRFTPFVAVGVGKWISPFWGVRLQVHGYSLNGYSTTEGTYLSDPLENGLYGTNDPVRNQVTIRPDGSYRHYLRYLNAQVAVEASLLSLWDGYHENRRWDIIPALGVGYLRSLGYRGTPATNNLSASFSLRGKYALTPRWDVNAEASAAAFDGSFDGRITRQRCEAYAGIALGVSYSFSRPGRKARRQEPQELPPAGSSTSNTILTNVEERLSAIEKKLDELIATPVKTVERVEKVVVEKEPEKKKSFVLSSILFGLNKTDLGEKQEFDLANVVDYLKMYPDVKIRLEGYADQATGNVEYNFKIAAERADKVRRILTETYAIEAGRVETQVLGSNVQPHEKYKWNRLVQIYVIE